jgi:rubrerythrin
MSQTFQKNIEDFICEQCGVEVKGNGYTNHCPKCLWSKHVDVNPGDRLADCKGMMKPVKVEKEKQEYVLVNECVKCGYTKRNRLTLGDSFDAAVKLVSQ